MASLSASFRLLPLFLATQLFSIAAAQDAAGSRPHIIFIMADDLGFNDVSFRGSNQIPTPNIDALAYSGLLLDRYYVTPLCTPSRSSLMTGRHPIHNGMQHSVLIAPEPRGLPLTEKLLPEYLGELGYRRHMVGKWHLGHYKKEYTPTYRGFESHLGYWTGHHDYNDHFLIETFTGMDMRRGLEAAWDLHGSYSTDVFTSEAVDIISSHNASEPLFLYVAHVAVHTGNEYNLLAAPDEVVAQFDYIDDYYRRRMAGILTKLDDSVGEIVNALSEANMLSNSVIIFSTDNGGAGEELDSAGSNWPLRGQKSTVWEGGVRGVGLIWSPLLASPKRVASQLMHVTDWLPTLYYLAGGDPQDLEDIDGINMWDALSNDSPSNRTQVLLNIDDLNGFAGLINGEWKLVKVTNNDDDYNSWYGASGLEDPTLSYDVEQVLNSTVGQALSREDYLVTADEALTLRSAATVSCNNGDTISCSPLNSLCLIKITEDPCEMVNLADSNPDILQEMEDLLAQINATAVPPSNVNIDPRADPALYDNTWNNFGDYIESAGSRTGFSAVLMLFLSFLVFSMII